MSETRHAGPGSPHAVIEARGLSKTFASHSQSTAAVQGVSLLVRRGEFVAIMGPSGSGKSTLLYLIAGLAKPTAGEVFIEGMAISSLPDAERTRLRSLKMGFVFQRFNLLGFLSVRHNIEVPRLLGWKNPERGRTIEELLAAVGMEGRIRQRVSELSAGEQQRVAIARALINEPDILLADEPTGNLDSRNAEAILDLLLRLQRELRLTILLVTHNPEVATLADRIVEMRDGSIRREWLPEQVRPWLEWNRKLTAPFPE
ncbi:MAG: ABC transporter ATP-binding protein [Acidobacteria bacterium]|nr:ABC transporter ATP-binding protein [Acidobacteriota bacterium]MBI1984440.1 ABC transporter ATP-binding protein [Acidobacteriota bacterium]